MQFIIDLIEYRLNYKGLSSLKRQKQHGMYYLMLLVLLNHVTCVTPQFIRAKAAWEHAPSHLNRDHYFLLALRPAAQLLSVYPPFGYRVCKHPPTLSWVCVHTFGIRFAKIDFIIHRI